MDKQLNQIAIFKTGVHTATNGQTLNADAAFLRDVVDSYQSSSYEAPAVIGHPKDNHPAYGKPYLRHVGFLGAQPPAVKGLKDFSDDGDCAVYEFSEPQTNEDKIMSKEKTEIDANVGTGRDLSLQQHDLCRGSR